MNRSVLDALKEAIIQFDIDNIKSLAEAALGQGVSAYDAVINGMVKGIDTIGQQYQSGECFLPELLMAGQTFKEGMKVLGPHLKPAEIGSRGRIVVGTVEGDIHDIGKNILMSMAEASGFEVYDLGVDVPSDRFFVKAKEVAAEVVAMSALLSTTYPHMKEVIDLIHGASLNSKTIVGGAPLNFEIAKSLGADGYGKSAIDGINICKQWADTSHE